MEEQQLNLQDNLKQQEQKQQYISFKQLLSPPNPITTKIIKQIKKQRNQKYYLQEINQVNTKQKIIKKITQGQLNLNNYYDINCLIFQKYQNKKYNTRSNIQYLSSYFQNNALQIMKLNKKYKGMIIEDNNLIFNSNYQSSNLFQVYKISDYEYDLILQNDINTIGYTQWFNFKVISKLNNLKIKFNIVNLYKSKALYQKGMKPLTKQSIGKDNKWHRNAYQVQYFENQIPTQTDGQKNYNTLSFYYDFKQQNNQVQFCHFYPYTFLEYEKFLQSIKASKFVNIKKIGLSNLKKPIHVIHISNENQIRQNKKVIIFIGRQHCGQTQSSFVIQGLIEFLIDIKEKQSQLLLSSFDIYIIPMLNVDGVFLGNYRTNAYGYDLNRYWQNQNNSKTPQINLFKSFVKNIQKRQQIFLILDLHGHSKKLNSFFFGNPIGKNYMIFPYIASTLSPMIDFNSCRFTDEKSQKSKTARSYFGNLMKSSTYFYTFQVSFWGYKNNNKINSFTIQNLKQLSKILISTIHKVHLEESKQDLTLKQSRYFKAIRRQLGQLNTNQLNKQSQSDEQATQMTIKEQIIKNNQKINDKVQKSQKQVINSLSKNKKYSSIGVQIDIKQQNSDIINNNSQNYAQELQIYNNQLINSFQQIRPNKIKSFNEKTQLFNKNKTIQQKESFLKEKLLFKNKIINQLHKNSLKYLLIQKLKIVGASCQQNVSQIKSFKNLGIQTNFEQFVIQKLKTNQIKKVNKDQTTHLKFQIINNKIKNIKSPNRKNYSQILPKERLQKLRQFLIEQKGHDLVSFKNITKNPLRTTRFNLQSIKINKKSYEKLSQRQNKTQKHILPEFGYF